MGNISNKPIVARDSGIAFFHFKVAPDDFSFPRVVS